MICKYCGKEINDGVKFCPNCGEKVETSSQKEESQTSLPKSASMLYDVQKETKKKMSSEGAGKYITFIPFAVAAVLIVAIIIGLTSKKSKDSTTENAYIVLRDGSFEILSNLKTGKTIEIASAESEDISSDMVSFSEDGKYVYYFTQYDSDTETGTLCRAEYGKFKNNSKNNDNYITIISENVYVEFTELGDEKLLYLNGDSVLYYYDGEDSVEIADSIFMYAVDDSSERLMYVTYDNDGLGTMYGVNLNEISDVNELASDVCYMVNYEDFDNIIYEEYNNQTYAYVLSVTGFDKNSEPFGSYTTTLNSVTGNGNGTVYFSIQDGVKLILYDYVIDDYGDINVTKPNIEDYKTVPVYGYVQLVKNYDLNDYDELYVTYSQMMYFYKDPVAKSGSYYGSLENIVKNTQGENRADAEAIAEFISKYEDDANEDGYILVTDEVKEDLIKIADAMEKDYQWVDFCHYRVQISTTYDYDAYNEAYDQYSEGKSLLSLRESLQSEDNAYACRTLYCYENGELSIIADDVFYTETFQGCIIYNSSDLIEKINIDEAEGTRSVTDKFYMDLSAENYLLTNDGDIYRISETAAAVIEDAEENGLYDIYVWNGDIFLDEYNGGTYVASINGDVIEEFITLCDDGIIIDASEDAVYYATDIYSKSSDDYFNLYAYSEGESKMAAYNVCLSNLNVYLNGDIIGFTGSQEITAFTDDGEVSFVIDLANRQYVKVDDSTLLYIDYNNSLYMHKNDENTEILDDVDMVWCLNEAPIAASLTTWHYKERLNEYYFSW